MTDYEIFRNMLDRAKIIYTLNEDRNDIKLGELKITVHASNDKIEDYWPNSGYTFFYTDFVFFNDGKLKSIGAYE